MLLIATGSRALCRLVPLQVSNMLAVGQQCLISSNPSDIWSPQQGTTTFTDTFMMFLHRYVDFELSCLIDFYLLFEDWQRFSSNSENSAHHVRRPEASPPPELEDDLYSDDNSLEEVDATLNNLDDEIDDTEHTQMGWSGSYSPGSAGRAFSSASGTFTYGTGSYAGSPSFASLPTFSPRSPIQHPLHPRIH